MTENSGQYQINSVAQNKDKNLLITLDEIEKVLKTSLTVSEMKLFLSLKCSDFLKQRPTARKLMKDIGVGKTTFYRAINRLQKLNILPESLVRNLDITSYSSVEQSIRNRMLARLGGQIEVRTAFGCVDLLTPTEIIEIKPIDDWKTALTEVQAYGAIFPTHKKRIHVFGTKEELTKLTRIKTACDSFDVSATGEEG
ncbi:hypothetical protein HW132_31045 [Brasilonema sp. CT11]|nr:hypothetical protein [Brasilonema sp. CT11]